MIDFLDLATKRQSDRAFDPNRSVEQDKIEKIIQAARLAPSACNSQPWHMIVVTDKAKLSELANAVVGKVVDFNHFAKQAPLHIIIVEERKNLTSTVGCLVKDKNFSQMDIGILSSYITLSAASQGLGSCIMGWFDEKKVRQVLDIPSGKRVLLDIVIGYSTQALREKKRKAIEDIVSYDTYR